MERTFVNKKVRLSEIDFTNEGFNYDPEELQRLKDSILKFGLLHPIIIQGDNPPYKLVVGRARFIATKMLETEFPEDQTLKWIASNIFPASDDGILDEVNNLAIISLTENLRRHNLPWYEQVDKEKELHELRIAQHGGKTKGRPMKNSTGWSQNDTARELGLALGTFSQDMALAVELGRNPNLRSVKDKTTALKIIKNITKRQIAEIEQGLPSDDVNNEILLGDSEVLLRTFKDQTFDLCITDPPWSEYKDDALRSDQSKLLPIFLELFRVLKRDSLLYIITSSTDFYFYTKELPRLGFRVQSYPIIWHKTKTITHGRAPWQYARDYEPILVAAKGSPSLTTGIEVSSILKFDNVHSSKLTHPHEKPLDLITSLLRVASHPGAKVVDPFAGSGVVLDACKKNDRSFIGIEKDKKFYDQIVERLK